MVLQSQLSVSGTKAFATIRTVIVSTLQSYRPQHGGKLLGPPTRVARSSSTGAAETGAGIRMILVEMSFHRPGRHLQDLAPDSGLQGFKVQRLGRRGPYQGLDFSLDLLRERLLEPFFSPVRAGAASSLA